MKLNSFLIILFSLFASQLLADDSSSLFKQANDFYAKNEFQKAIALYEKVEATGMVSAELYYNIGNAYYKNNEIGKAILNYERAKKINPEDEDINFNLKLANQKTEDKIEKQDMDDHYLCYSVYKKLGKVCGLYWINFESQDSWGGTRVPRPACWTT